MNDCVNEFVHKAKEADGFVFGSPVYYAHPSGRLLTFLDRAFYSNANAFKYKPAAWRFIRKKSGERQPVLMSSTNIFQISSMPIVSSNILESCIWISSQRMY